MSRIYSLGRNWARSRSPLAALKKNGLHSRPKRPLGGLACRTDQAVSEGERMQVYPSQGGNGLVVKLAIHVLRGAKPQSLPQKLLSNTSML